MNNINSINSKTQLGLNENIEAALCYFLGFVTGIVFFMLEPNNRTIKFHAVQSIAIFGLLLILNILVSVISIFSILWILNSIVSLVGFALWIVLIIKAYQGEKYKLPVIGDIAENVANS